MATNNFKIPKSNKISLTKRKVYRWTRAEALKGREAYRWTRVEALREKGREAYRWTRVGALREKRIFCV